MHQVDDMIKLGELTEENIFKNLATRYEISPNTKHFSIYTYTG
jgi:myosin heavy subunit